jgi:deoxyribonuclease-1
MSSLKVRLFSVILSLFAATAYADQVIIPNYDTARDTYFYNQLYSDGGETIYCQAEFETRSGLNVEHVYPASWMKDTAGCPGLSRKECRRVCDRFNIMEADLHNLYPALAKVNQDRSNYLFGIIGEDDCDKTYDHPRVQDGCDFEVDPDSGVVEIRRLSRGEVARAIFYMNYEYGAPIDPEMGELLVTWHFADPPDDMEKERNNKIENIQGTRNPYIDDPSLANNFSFSAVNGEPPQSCLIKGNISRSGRIYHVPGSRYYEKVKIDTSKGERWFCSVEEAVDAGWRTPN